MSSARICAHCLQRMRGHARVNDAWLCHPDDGLDCCQLVTIYRHPMPCPSCPGEAGMFTLDQALNLDVGP